MRSLKTFELCFFLHNVKNLTLCLNNTITFALIQDIAIVFLIQLFLYILLQICYELLICH